MRKMTSCLLMVSLLFLAAATHGAAQADPVYKGKERKEALTEQELADQERAREAKVVQAKLKQKDALRRVTATQEKLRTEFPKEKASWDAEVEPLLENTAGRSIAVDETALGRFSDEYKGPRVTQETVTATLEELDTLAGPLKNAVEDPNSAYEPDAAFLADIEKRERFANEALAGYRAPREAIGVLAKRAQAEHPDGGPRTLKEAMAERGATVRAAQMDAEKTTKNTLAETQLKELLDAREKRRALEARASDPANLARFQTFLASSKSRFSGGRYGKGEHPAALDDMQKAGALRSADAMVAAATDRRNYKRPHWSERATSDLEKVRAAYADLVLFAPIWVEQCRLLKSPQEGNEPEPRRLARCQEFYGQKRREREAKEAEEEARLRKEIEALR